MSSPASAPASAPAPIDSKAMRAVRDRLAALANSIDEEGDADGGISDALERAVASPMSPASPYSMRSPSSASSNASGSASPAATTTRLSLASFRFVVCHSRKLKQDELAELAKHFSAVLQYSTALHQNKNDLDSLAFDCLIVDVTDKDSLTWLSEVLPQIKQDPQYKLIFIRRSSRLCLDWGDGLEVLSPDAILKSIPTGVDHPDSFARKLLAMAIPKLISAGRTLFKKVISKAGN